MSTTRTIVVKGSGIRKEAEAAGVIVPGHILELTSTGTVQAVSAADDHVQMRVAVENEVIGNGVDDNYASGDWVLFEVLERGAEFYAVVAAGAAAITWGDFLNVKADGTVLTAVDASANRAVALESVDNSGGGAVTWILCEAL